MDKILVKKLTEDAELPTRGSANAAGLDLYSNENFTIYPKNRAMISTGISIAIPEDTYLRIAPRSGLAYKHGIDVLAGVCDVDYRGPINVILFNSGDEPFKINKGDRIAQAICEVIKYPTVIEVNELPDTERGSDGFGSTGV